MEISNQGVGEVVLTMKAEEGVKAGMLVSMSNKPSTVKISQSNDHILGVVKNIRDGYAAVQIEGVATIKLTEGGALGWMKVSGNGDGTIKVNPATGDYRVILDHDDETMTIIL